MNFKHSKEYVSPAFEVIGICCDGVVLSGSVEAGLGFTLDEDPIVEGETIII